MFTKDEFAKRRQLLISQMADNSIAIVAASLEHPRNADCFYRYRQDSNFFYLTGFTEPKACAVIVKGREKPYILFNRKRDKEQEIWHGLRAGQQGACEHYGVDEAYPVDDLDSLMPQLLEGIERIYYPFNAQNDLAASVKQWMHEVSQKVRSGVHAPTQLSNLETLLDEMRIIKSDEEVGVMRKVCALSAKAHRDAMEQVKTMNYEHQVEALLLHRFHDAGCRAPAYEPIVGSGANACILHYTENDAKLSKGDLLLIDAGAELHHYAADITRTFPIGGKFSVEQKAIYELVLRAQKAGISIIKPGLQWHKIQQVMVEVLCAGLLELGLLQGELDTLIQTKAYRKFYMHNSGHWLGLDTHDVGDYKVNGQWRALQAGMILTVEPGIYIASDTPGVDPKWWNIGIRIEDDVLVTEDGHDVLTDEVPKEVDEIERLMA